MVVGGSVRRCYRRYGPCIPGCLGRKANVDGECGKFFQSEREEIYGAHLDQLKGLDTFRRTTRRLGDGPGKRKTKVGRLNAANDRLHAVQAAYGDDPTTNFCPGLGSEPERDDMAGDQPYSSPGAPFVDDCVSPRLVAWHLS